jgi:hypothetical protein
MYRNTAGPTMALVVLGFLVALVPLANASPPDPTWIPGIYDDADFDDVILIIVSAVGAASPSSPVIVVSEASLHRIPQPRPSIRERRPRLTVDRSPPFLPA